MCWCDSLTYFTRKTKQRVFKVCSNYKTLHFCLVCLAWSATRFSRQPAQNHCRGPQREEHEGSTENPGALSQEQLCADWIPLQTPSGDCQLRNPFALSALLWHDWHTKCCTYLMYTTWRIWRCLYPRNHHHLLCLKPVNHLQSSHCYLVPVQ